MRLKAPTYLIATMAILLGTAGMGSAQEEKELSLFGRSAGGEIHLYWETYAWPADLMGFNLYRRVVIDSIPGEWEMLNRQPLSPDVSFDEDWANQGLTPMEAIDMDSTVRQYYREGNIDTAGGHELVAVLKANNGTGSGDRIRMKNDFKLALILDFAYIDHNVIDELTYEYAIYKVYDDGVEAGAPSDVFSTAMLAEPEYNIAFQKLIKGIAFNWTLDREQYKGRAINGFFVYRRQPGETEYDQLVFNPIGSYKEVEEMLMWRFNDLLADNGTSWEFGIAYVDVFQQMSAIHWELYDAEYHTPVAPATIDSTGLRDGEHVYLAWSLPEESQGKATAWVLEMAGDAEPGEWKFKALTDTLNAGTTEWVDTLYKDYGDIYFYRVGLIDKYGRCWYSEQASVYYMGLIKPMAVLDLKAEPFARDGEPWVRLSWKENSDDSLVKGYIIYTDELIPDSLLHISAIPMFKKTSYEYRIPNRGGREYTIGIAPISDRGAEGDRSTYKVYVPITKMPPLYTFKATLEDNLSVTIAWDYPVFRELKGFELYMNDELIAGPDKLGATDSTFNVKRIEKAEGSRYCTFHMKAIGEGMKTDLSMPQKLYLANISLSDIMPPDSLEVELRKDSTSFYALLSWAEVDLDSADYRGYMLYADYYSEGSVHLLKSIPLITEFTYAYKLPDPGRNSYTLRIAALGNDETVGRYAQVRLQLDDEARAKARPLNDDDDKENKNESNGK